jgi:hypothetical protein
MNGAVPTGLGIRGREQKGRGKVPILENIHRKWITDYDPNILATREVEFQSFVEEWMQLEIKLIPGWQDMGGTRQRQNIFVIVAFIR